MARRKNIKITKKNLPIIIIAAVLIVIFGILEKSGVIDKLNEYAAPNVSVSQNEDALLTAHFIDVGQGDCTLFISGEDTMLIDCGEAEYADTVIKALRSYGVTELDYVVATHAHTDHMGGMAYILDTVPTENIIISEPSKGSLSAKHYGEFLDAADNSGADIIFAEPDYTFSLGNAECKILAPFSVSDEENNNSVVMHITAGTTSFLMTGDAEKAVEKEIIEKYPLLRATILKAGHHGSKTSSHNNFVSMLKSETVIIPVGSGNSYGHPHEEILDIYDKYGMDCYRTDTDGTITVNCFSDSYKVSTER